ncbi:MAG: septum formation protein Maf [Deltaproteobacteria bacterium]|nr:septum formation protein Maf [Deltaproteobacteria bacterium]
MGLVQLQPFILASNSPRRRRLLANLGLVFEVYPSQSESGRHPSEAPPDFAQRQARIKGRDIAAQFPETWTLAADTIVVLGDQIMGKPSHETEAVEMLLALNGRGHQVVTAFCLRHQAADREVCRAVTSEVFFKAVIHDTITAYVATGEPQDKAGAYGIQGRGGALIDRIAGSYDNVVGLPVAEVIAEMITWGILRSD